MTVSFLICAAIGLSLAGAYVFIIHQYIKGWRALPEWELPPNYLPKTKVSILVPARNEEKNILTCLQSLTAQNYPAALLEIIVIDDHSTDKTAALVSVFSKKNKNVKLLRLAEFVNESETQSFKKKAIDAAISQAEGELIVTTDADCEAPPDWLQLLVSFFQESGNQFIAAPVNFHHEKNILERFQSLDFIGMMGVTGAGIHLGWMNMCNGANLAYSKSAFRAFGGFQGIDHLASGDDILLMQKMAKHFPGKIGFLKTPKATVLTKAKPDLKSFFSQRLRWATKSTSYSELSVTFILAVVLFLCLGILVSAAVGLFSGWPWLALSVCMFLVKSGADYFFLGEMSRYFGRRDLMRFFFASQILHIIYIASVGLMSNFKKQYEWKGRRVK